MVKVIWRKSALEQLNKAYEYIKKDSVQSAEKVRDVILNTAERLKDNPEIYPLDRYRKNNDESIRAFECYSYRVAYQITPTEIRILRLRHTGREPLDY